MAGDGAIPVAGQYHIMAAMKALFAALRRAPGIGQRDDFAAFQALALIAPKLSAFQSDHESGKTAAVTGNEMARPPRRTMWLWPLYRWWLLLRAGFSCRI